MSLIEKLGYDDCKSVLNGKRYDDISYSVDLNQYYNYLASEHGAIDITELEDELLEYRRQNGIYEVGDSVVPISSKFCSDVYRLVNDHGYDFRYETKDKKWGFIVKSFMPPKWRHATDKEINQGYRDE